MGGRLEGMVHRCSPRSPYSSVRVYTVIRNVLGANKKKFIEAALSGEGHMRREEMGYRTLSPNECTATVADVHWCAYIFKSGMFREFFIFQNGFVAWLGSESEDTCANWVNLTGAVHQFYSPSISNDGKWILNFFFFRFHGKRMRINGIFDLVSSARGDGACDSSENLTKGKCLIPRAHKNNTAYRSHIYKV